MSFSKKTAWILWGLLSFFYGFQFIIRLAPSVMLPDILSKFHITAFHFGHYSGAYYLGYALAHVPLGFILDRYPLKWVVSSTIVLSVVGLVPLVLTHNWFLSVFGRFLIGIGSSGAILAIFKVLNLYFPTHLFSRLLGFSVTIGLMGAVYGSGPVYYLSSTYGWEDVLMGLVIVGFGLAFILLFIHTSPQKITHTMSLRGQCGLILRHRSVLITALLAAFMVGPLEGFADVWAVPFLKTVYGLDMSLASFLPSFIFIGMGIGGPLLASISEKYQAYEKVLCMAAGLMMVLFVCVVWFHMPIGLVALCFFIMGILCAYQILALTLNSRRVPEQYRTLTTALTNMVIMAFGSIYHLLIGYHMGHYTVYTTQNFRYGLLSIPVGLGLAFVGFIIMRKNTNCLKI